MDINLCPLFGGEHVITSPGEVLTHRSLSSKRGKYKLRPHLLLSIKTIILSLILTQAASFLFKTIFPISFALSKLGKKEFTK